MTGTADVWIGDEGYYVHDDTKTLEHVPCGTHLFGDTTIAEHECYECAGCGEFFTELPVGADKSFFPDTRRYCHDDCLENASERYWMGVWSA